MRNEWQEAELDYLKQHAKNKNIHEIVTGINDTFGNDRSLPSIRSKLISLNLDYVRLRVPRSEPVLTEETEEIYADPWKIVEKVVDSFSEIRSSLEHDNKELRESLFKKSEYIETLEKRIDKLEEDLEDSLELMDNLDKGKQKVTENGKSVVVPHTLIEEMKKRVSGAINEKPVV